MTVSKFRSVLYKIARWLGHYSAARNGTIHKRIPRIILGRIFTRIIRLVVK